MQIAELQAELIEIQDKAAKDSQIAEMRGKLEAEGKRAAALEKECEVLKDELAQARHRGAELGHSQNLLKKKSTFMLKFGLCGAIVIGVVAVVFGWAGHRRSVVALWNRFRCDISRSISRASCCPCQPHLCGLAGGCGYTMGR